MKITDFALLFIGITLPIMIIVYVNVSFTIKAQEQEMYYKKIINLALKDASDEMKEVENTDSEIDYGYSGTNNNKVSVNSQIAVDTFLNSLYNNFGIKGNLAAERYLQLFVPAIAIIDYNGVQISSIERYTDTTDPDVINGRISGDSPITKHALKPKRHYSYNYVICKDKVDLNKYVIQDDTSNVDETKVVSRHSVEFTMDDYITHRGYYIENGQVKDMPVKSFYMSDENNNYYLIGEDSKATINNNSNLKDILSETVKHLQNKRKEVIIETIQKELQYATNNNNYYAAAAGIKYNFVFPTFTVDELDNQIKNVGIVAFVQGISIGNRYLNASAYSSAKLENTTKYYLSLPYIKTNNTGSKINMNLYHKDTKCPEYRVSIHENITPEFTFTKQQAASVKAMLKTEINGYTVFQGFYPCPICNP